MRFKGEIFAIYSVYKYRVVECYKSSNIFYLLYVCISRYNQILLEIFQLSGCDSILLITYHFIYHALRKIFLSKFGRTDKSSESKRRHRLRDAVKKSKFAYLSLCDEPSVTHASRCNNRRFTARNFAPRSNSPRVSFRERAAVLECIPRGPND